MATNITVDATSLNKGVQRSLDRITGAALRAVNDVASEILRLSSFEVPHDTGMLQTSGHIEPNTDKSVIVGYNKVYAARLHEHPEYRFQKGRKGKYLEDPIKNNLEMLRTYIVEQIQKVFE